MKKKGFPLILLIILLLITLCSCQFNIVNNESSPNENLVSYFPLNDNLYYYYRGEGNEYASFHREVKHLEAPYIQIHDNNGGTIMAGVYRVNEKEICRILHQGEYYGDESLIEAAKKKDSSEEIILKTPLKKGMSWETNEKVREIIAVEQTVTVPAGTFYDVIKVKVTSEKNNYTGYEYYAPNVGLIKQEHIGEGYNVRSKLERYMIGEENKRN